jgi:hypothetical protein
VSSSLFFGPERHNHATIWAQLSDADSRSQTPKCLCCNYVEGRDRTPKNERHRGFKPRWRPGSFDCPGPGAMAASGGDSADR